MQRVETISLEEVRRILRQGRGGKVENRGGWCVFVDASGNQRYVVDGDHAAPIAYQSMSLASGNFPGLVNHPSFFT